MLWSFNSACYFHQGGSVVSPVYFPVMFVSYKEASETFWKSYIGKIDG